MAYIPENWKDDLPPPIDDVVMLKIENGIKFSHEKIAGMGGPESTYFVSPNFVVSDESHRYDTIQGAIDHAIMNMPPSPGTVSIIVYPGIYEEQITNTDSRIYISGSSFAPQCIETYCTLEHPSVLYNTGIDAAHYPFGYTGTSVLNLSNMTIKVDDGEVFGEFSNIMFDKCYFSGGHFIEYLDTGGRALEFINCVVRCNLFDLNGITGDRFVYFHATYLFGSGSMNFNSTGGNKDIRTTLTIIYSNILIAGDWSIAGYMVNVAENGLLRFDTTGNIKIDTSIQPNGIHFISNPAGIKIITNCNFMNPLISPTHKDVSADVIITDVIYSDNIQQNGISGNIQTASPEKHVGKHTDHYFDLQSAITSIHSGETATIRVWEDLTNLPEITIPNANTNIKIKGQKAYSLAFTGDIVEIGADRIFGFNDMVQLTGGNVHLNGTNAEISFESCQYVVGYITIDLGAFAILYKSSLFGSTGHKAVYMNNLDTPVILGYSRIQGSVGNPAVEFNAASDTKFKAKFSTFIHGDKGGICPLLNSSGVASINIAAYLCGVNKLWSSPNPFKNVISKAGIIDDAEINF